MWYWNYIFLLIICVISSNFKCEGIEIETPFDLHIQKGTKMTIKENIGGSLFGFSLALRDETLFVGAPKYDGKGGVFHCNLEDCIIDNECFCDAISSFNEKGNYY